MGHVTINDITDRNIESVNKFIKVLSYLNIGGELESEGRRYKLAENNDGVSFSIVQVLTSTNTLTSETKEIVVGSDIESFIKVCGRLSESEITVLNANKVLNEITRKR